MSGAATITAVPSMAAATATATARTHSSVVTLLSKLHSSESEPAIENKEDDGAEEKFIEAKFNVSQSIKDQKWSTSHDPERINATNSMHLVLNQNGSSGGQLPETTKPVIKVSASSCSSSGHTRCDKSNSRAIRQSPNQTSAIKQVNTTIASNCNQQHQQGQYQFQYQEEFNKMRERLFRLLSKVPIHVDTVTSFPETLTCSSSANSNSSSGSISGGSATTRQVYDRDPLIIKYYNERSLSDILRLHFSCSLIKHNYDRQLALNTHLQAEEVGLSSLNSNQHQYSCLPNQLPQTYSMNETATTTTMTSVHGLVVDNHQLLNYQQDHNHHQQQYAEWQQHQTTASTIAPSPQTSSSCTFQWQIQPNYETLEKQKLSGSCAANSNSCRQQQQQQHSSHRRSSATPILMKESNLSTTKVKPSPLLGNGINKTKQRRPAKQLYTTRLNGNLRDDNLSSSPSTGNNRTADSLTATFYHPTQNGKSKCYPEISSSLINETGHYICGDVGGGGGGVEIFANQLQSAAPPTATTTTSTTFNNPLSIPPDGIMHHNSLYNQQQTDHNIHLHLYTQPTSYQHLQPLALQNEVIDTNSSLNLPTQLTDSQHDSLMMSQYNLQPPQQISHHLDHHNHTNNGQQIIYNEHLNEVEQAQLLQQPNHLSTLNHEQSSNGIQYYTTTNNHPSGNYQQQQLQSLELQTCDNSQSANNWRQQLCPVRSEHLAATAADDHQQMIEQQQQQLCDNYVRERSFYMGPTGYSMLYANSGRQQPAHEVVGVELQVDLATLNDHQHQQ